MKARQGRVQGGLLKKGQRGQNGRNWDADGLAGNEKAEIEEQYGLYGWCAGGAAGVEDSLIQQWVGCQQRN